MDNPQTAVQGVSVGLLTLVLVLGGISTIFVVVAKDRKHKALMRRMELYREWVETVPTTAEPERTQGRQHIERILTSGRDDDFRGPWENRT
jgi:hypothetical protein